MNYTLHQLRVFLAVVDHTSVTKAADALHLTQPAVSIQLKKLQDQFPLPLIEVIGRKVHVTSFGKEIAEGARHILDEVEAIDYRTQQYQGKLAGKLSISVVSTGKYVMPYYLSDFVNAHPGIDFSMDVTNKLTVVSHLEQNSVDFALVSVLPEQLSLERLSLLPNSLHLVAGTVRERSRKGPVELIFKEQPLLFREQGSATRNAMEQFILQHDLPIYKRIELTSNEALKQAIIAGLGYSIMPMIGIRNAVERGDIAIIDYPQLPIITEWNLVWLKAKKLTPVATAFIDFLKAEKQRITTAQFSWTM